VDPYLNRVLKNPPPSSAGIIKKVYEPQPQQMFGNGNPMQQKQQWYGNGI
jgi:hypothetical protein